MISNFCIVENAFVRLHPIVVEHLAREWIVDLGQRRSYCGEVILRQRTRVRAWIGNCFVLLIKGLRDLQCAFRREPEAIVRFALQSREIIQLRRDLCGRFFLFQFDDPLFATAFALNGVRDFAMPQSRRSAVLVPERTVYRIKSLLGIGQIQLKATQQSLGSLAFSLVLFKWFIEPTPRIFARCSTKFADDLVYLARFELQNFSLAVHDDRQRRSLHAAKRSDRASTAAAEPQRKRTRRVDADQPVCFVPAPRCAGERLHLSVGAQSVKAVANRLRRHRLQPETLDRLFCACVLDDIAKDQFTFATGVAGIDDIQNVFVFDEFAKNIDPTAHFFCRRKFEFRRHDGQFLHIPLVLCFHRSGYRELEEVTNRPRDEIFLVLVVILALFEATQRLGDVAGNRWLLCNYERLGHGGSQSNPLTGLLQVGDVF